MFHVEALACASPEPAEEGGTNVDPEEAAQSCKRAGPGAALEGGYAARITADRFVQVEERAVELGATAEGDTRAGANAAEQMHTLPGVRPFHLLNEKSTCMIFCVCVMCPDNRAVSCHVYY